MARSIWDIGALAKHMRALITDPKLRAALARAGRRRSVSCTVAAAAKIETRLFAGLLEA